MQALFYLGVTLTLLGIFLMVKNSGRKMYIGGIFCIAIGIFFTFYGFNGNGVTTNLLGISFPKQTPDEVMMEMHYFATEAEATQYYKVHKPKFYILTYRFNNDSRDFFDFINTEKTKDGGKLILFQSDQKKGKQAMDFVNSYFYQHQLVVKYNSSENKKKK